MARALATVDSLAKLLDQSSRPFYVVDAQRRIVYGNRALSSWMNLESKRIVGRRVEYHSEEPSSNSPTRDDSAPLADLCPPPRALAGEPCTGTISCLARDGRLVHRQAEFLPLALTLKQKAEKIRDQAVGHGYVVLVLLAGADMSPQEVAAELSGESTADELHRTIRRFRRGQAARYSIESLLGNSPAMQKVRAQVAAAAASGANTLIYGPRGSGRGHVARAIHYRAAGDSAVRLVPLNGELLTDDLLRRAADALRGQHAGGHERPTLLLENLDQMSTSHRSQLLAAIRQKTLAARIIATVNAMIPPNQDETEVAEQDGRATTESGDKERVTIGAELMDAISTITIRMPPLADRLEDLPILAQSFLESCNRGSSKQIGALRSDVLDMLSLYSWPGELQQLRDVIEAAHSACSSHEIAPADLPAIIHHASSAAARLRRPPERIVLDELLASIEREAIVRALAQSGGNKSETAELLGMTRPRLYRRLVQLGLAGETTDELPPEEPEFIERDPAE